jgi:hypothetical protein
MHRDTPFAKLRRRGETRKEKYHHPIAFYVHLPKASNENAAQAFRALAQTKTILKDSNRRNISRKAAKSQRT